jgi:transposase-like protein
VSRRFIEESRKTMLEFKARKFSGKIFFALVIDGTYVSGQAVVTAVGVDTDGNKHFIGYFIGSSENTEVVKSLLDLLDEKEVSFTENILCDVDGSKSLERAITDKYGARVYIQRCKIHKLRNVYAKIPKKYYPEFKQRYDKIFTCELFDDAKSELASVSKWLSKISFSAKESLDEAGDKLITLQKIGMPGNLMRSFNTTNIIESAFSAPKSTLRRVKKWRLETDMLDRWISISLLYQEKKFRKVRGVNSLNTFIYKFTKMNFSVDLKNVA